MAWFLYVIHPDQTTFDPQRELIAYNVGEPTSISYTGLDGTRGFLLPGPTPLGWGVTWDGNNFWITDWNDGRIDQVDYDGNVVNSYPNSPSHPWNTLRDITWDGTRLWAINNFEIIEINPANGEPTGNTVQLPNPSSDTPHGLASDGTSLYLSFQDEFGDYRLARHNGSSWVENVDANIMGLTPGLHFEAGYLWASAFGAGVVYRWNVNPLSTPTFMFNTNEAGNGNYGLVWVEEPAQPPTQLIDVRKWVWNLKSLTINYDGGLSASALMSKAFPYTTQIEVPVVLDAGFILGDGWFGTHMYKIEVPTESTDPIQANVYTEYDNPISDSSIDGMVFDGEYLWFSDPNGMYDGQKRLLKINPSTLDIVFASTPVPISTSIRDMALDGDYLRVVNGSRIYRYHMPTDSFTDFVTDNTGSWSSLNTLEYRDGFLWVVRNEPGGYTTPNRMYKLNASDGTVIESKVVVGINGSEIPWGLQYHNGYFWIGVAGSPYIAKYDWDAGEVVQKVTFSHIHADFRPFTLTYVPEGVM